MQTIYRKIRSTAFLIAWLGSGPLLLLGQTAPAVVDPNDPAGNLSRSAASSMEGVTRQLPDLSTKLLTSPSSSPGTTSDASSKKDDGKTNAAPDPVGNLDEQLKSMDSLMTTALDNPLIKQHFLNYLDSEEVPTADLAGYQTKVQQTQDMLHQGDVLDALKLLYALGRYDAIDGHISIELAHRIETTLGMRIQNDELDRANVKLAQQVGDDIWNADMDAKTLDVSQGKDDGSQSKSTSSTNSAAESTSGSNGANVKNDSNSNNSADSNNKTYALVDTGHGSSLNGETSNLGFKDPGKVKGGTVQLAQDLYLGSQAQIQLKLNELRKQTNDATAKADFVAYITSLVGSRRYTHAILAAAFYRAMYDTEEYPVGVADQINLAQEINNQASQATQALTYNLNRNYVCTATMDLQTAFIANEYYSGFQALPREKKAFIHQFLDKVVFLKNAIRARDFDRVKSLTDSTSALAVDFDPTQALQLVNAIKLQSLVHLGKARLLTQKNDLDGAMKEFQEAGEIWPNNPDLQNSATSFFSAEDPKAKTIEEFDRLINAKNYREIYDRQVYFATGIAGDKGREDQMKTALEAVQKAETAYQKANLFLLHSDACGAWETLQTALDDDVDDAKVNKLFLEVSMQAPDFVQALTQARKAEHQSAPGYCLALYLKAQTLYPASDLANSGVQRLSQLVLSEGNSRP